MCMTTLAQMRSITLCKNKMRSNFTAFWNSELSMADLGSVRNSKFRTYKQFKRKFALENYLIVTPNFENRKLIAEFRCGDHELMIEKGRYKKIEERRCYICSKKSWKMSCISYKNALLMIELELVSIIFFKSSSPQSE